MAEGWYCGRGLVLRIEDVGMILREWEGCKKRVVEGFGSDGGEMLGCGLRDIDVWGFWQCSAICYLIMYYCPLWTCF